MFFSVLKELKINIKCIAQIICSVAERENKELYDIARKGIFHMPELAFAYKCGKAIMKNRDDCFGENTVEWYRELNLKNGGPTDLVFKLSSGYTIAIEFKVRGTLLAYQKDVEKLSKIKDDKCIQLFCALIDVFNHQLPDDGRQTHIDNLLNYQVTSLHKVTFNTTQDRYITPVSCVARVWRIGNLI